MKRVMVMFGMIVLVGLPNLVKGQARGIGGIGPVRYRSGSYGYVDRGGGWYGGRDRYCGDDNESFYGPGSVSDFAFGWRADRVLKMQEKEQDFRQEQERRAEEKEIFQRANQAGKLQHEIEQLERENQRLKEKIAELERKID